MKTQRCDGVTRRDLIRIGGLSALGIGLGDFFRMQRAVADSKGSVDAKAKSCILIWLDGGPTHLETFDPKPDAPAEVRGPLGSVATKVNGVRINEYMPRTAASMNDVALVRSMTSPLGEHSFGSHYLLTGYRPSAALEYPSFGSTLAHARSHSVVLPPNIAVPRFSKSVTGNGFLPSSTAPFAVGGIPDRPDFKVRDLDFYKGLDLTRLDRRRKIVNAFDQFARAKDAAATTATDSDLERAYNLIASKEAKAAFKLSEEPTNIRNLYGRTGANSVGQSCLLARRLVERGVTFVTVNSVGWDTHQDLNQLKQRFPNDRNAHLPALDRAISGLITDLSQRGMLDSTLIVVMGEFGRTPKINARGGRDHWPNCFSVALAGGGIRGGQVVGISDSLGERPKDNPVTPSDLAATIYTLLGIDPASELHTSDGRPIRVTPDGARVVKELLS
ncbi:MAG: hypothetical protein CMJ78_19125 [Planctomycetaceae bacterium]|nr:hypothetical protein [Planctomycetaceae bacterium]